MNDSPCSHSELDSESDSDIEFGSEILIRCLAERMTIMQTFVSCILLTACIRFDIIQHKNQIVNNYLQLDN